MIQHDPQPPIWGRIICAQDHVGNSGFRLQIFNLPMITILTDIMKVTIWICIFSYFLLKFKSWGLPWQKYHTKIKLFFISHYFVIHHKSLRSKVCKKKILTARFYFVNDVNQIMLTCFLYGSVFLVWGYTAVTNNYSLNKWTDNCQVNLPAI